MRECRREQPIGQECRRPFVGNRIRQPKPANETRAPGTYSTYIVLRDTSQVVAERQRHTSVTYTEPTQPTQPTFAATRYGWVRSLLLRDESGGLASQMKRCSDFSTDVGTSYLHDITCVCSEGHAQGHCWPDLPGTMRRGSRQFRRTLALHPTPLRPSSRRLSWAPLFTAEPDCRQRLRTVTLMRHQQRSRLSP